MMVSTVAGSLTHGQLMPSNGRIEPKNAVTVSQNDRACQIGKGGRSGAVFSGGRNDMCLPFGLLACIAKDDLTNTIPDRVGVAGLRHAGDLSCAPVVLVIAKIAFSAFPSLYCFFFGFEATEAN
jgi:hypothetical protein